MNAESLELNHPIAQEPEVVSGGDVAVGRRLATARFDWDQADWFGIFCSLGCAIHCAAMPVILAVLPSMVTLNWLRDPIFHQLVAIACGVAMAKSLWPDWRKHRNAAVGWCGAGGIGMLLLASFVLPDQCCYLTGVSTWGGSVLTVSGMRQSLGEYFTTQVMAMQPWITPVGSVLLVTAHIVNIRLRCCARSACRESA